MSGMRAQIANRLRSSSLHAAPPPRTSDEYSRDLAKTAASVLFRSPMPSKDGRPVFILNAAALPDSREADFDSLLPYVLARFPEEDELVRGYEYEVVFFAGDGGAESGDWRGKKRPGWGWFLQAYHVLSRAMRKRLKMLYIVHEKAWVRILTEIFSTIVSPKFRRKIAHASTLTNLANQIPIENLLIPPSTYLHDRRVSDDIFAPFASGRRAFCARQPFPTATYGRGRTRFPRVLRETTSFLLMPENIISEGLFRVPPHSKLRDVLKEAYDRGQKFIVYKDNGVTLPIPPYTGAEQLDDIINEVDPKEAYSVFMAAALIKAWYADLRQPIFPQLSYRDLKRLYGDPEAEIGLDRLIDLLSPSSEWSFLPAISRQILIRHLLPVLSAVVAHQDQNKMPAENLAVCFAPALLCGPDQLEDAKMSSIIRRIVTEAIETWSHGLREACGAQEGDLQEELRLPKDEADWDDPVEPKRGDKDARDSIDENQRTGVIPMEEEQQILMQDNDVYTEPTDEKEQMPPPLPPRSRDRSTSGSRVVSGRNTNDSVNATKRKPAPPLQVPPRYSTIVSDSPHDLADSPAALAAVTDGFSPRREDTTSSMAKTPSQYYGQDEKKSGTKNSSRLFSDQEQFSAPVESALDEKSPSSAASAPPQIVLPKRKALTAEQIDNADSAAVKSQERKASEGEKYSPHQGGMALPGLANLSINTSESTIKRKAVPSAAYTSSPANTSPSNSPSASSSTLSAPAPVNESRRPSLPNSATANKQPNITSLARPVYPVSSTTVHPVTNRPPSKSTSLPVPGPKPRTPSPSLLKRMPSFGGSKQTEFDDSAGDKGGKLTPKKINLKNQSVDDLRRLYEERAGTAGLLVEAGKRH